MVIATNTLSMSFQYQSRGRGFKSRRARQSINRLGGGGALSPPSTCPELALFSAAPVPVMLVGFILVPFLAVHMERGPWGAP